MGTSDGGVTRAWGEGQGSLNGVCYSSPEVAL